MAAPGAGGAELAAGERGAGGDAALVPAGGGGGAVPELGPRTAARLRGGAGARGVPEGAGRLPPALQVSSTTIY